MSSPLQGGETEKTVTEPCDGLQNHEPLGGHGLTIHPLPGVQQLTEGKG